MIAEPDKKYAMAFFDGQNLYRHAKDAFGHHHPNYDPIKLHAAVCAQKGWIPNLVRFYTGVPSAIESPMWAAYWSNRVLALKRAGVSVTTRPIRYHKETIIESDGTQRIITTPQEKGIDVRLALDLVARARKREFQVAVIYSQDQDLCEIVQDDLTPDVHPAIARVLWSTWRKCAGGATNDRRSWSGLRSRSFVAVRLAA